MASNKLTDAVAKKKAQSKVKVVKQAKKLVAMDPASPEAMLAELREASSWSQGQAALVALFEKLLSN